MMVLASVRRPSAIIAGTSCEGEGLDRHGLLLGALPVVGHLAEVGGQEDRSPPRRRSPAVVDVGEELEASRPAGRSPPPARGRRSPRWPRRLVAQAGGELQQLLVDRAPVLADHASPSAVVEQRARRPRRPGGGPRPARRWSRRAPRRWPSTTRMRWRAISSRSETCRNSGRDNSRAVQREEVGRPALGPLEGGADELPEQRGRPGRAGS